jgi:hypothetical protein
MTDITITPRRAHLIDDISFSKDFIVCTCAWKGPVDDFAPHRQDATGKCPSCPHSMLAHRDNGKCGNCRCAGSP